ncbi:hypothetical protein BCV69DRAFT_297415 [Microstroma glucosiphilum]|uniref:Uncharacterized protein n=1 Tax=Pseudomicrostroma glucosiphilum TaxID=1684307 RepID=A0A316UA55_9BASI|nr:hypothetical protein BCV69DRAFT_297415 [Pseudomicrostroma glucosiphilum]PWN22110.1 hypothetical protein BCV69DRAFT_297415 [Pseudomicrostroma glucosiphilum]
MLGLLPKNSQQRREKAAATDCFPDPASANKSSLSRLAKVGYRQEQHTSSIQMYTFWGHWVRLPYQLPAKLGSVKSSTDALVDTFHEIAAAGNGGKQVKQRPAAFRP